MYRLTLIAASVMASPALAADWSFCLIKQYKLYCTAVVSFVHRGFGKVQSAFDLDRTFGQTGR